MAANDDTEHGSPVPFLPEDWPQQVTAKLVDAVDTVRAKTSGPAIRISRAVVYGLVAGLLGLLALPLVLIALTRAVTNGIDEWFGVDRAAAVWLTYLAMGALFTLAGLFAWTKRPRGAARPSHAA